jgi:hypothetical protein
MDVTPAGIDAVIADITGRVVARGTYRTPGRAGADAVQAVHAARRVGRDVELKIRDLTHVVAATPGAPAQHRAARLCHLRAGTSRDSWSS